MKRIVAITAALLRKREGRGGDASYSFKQQESIPEFKTKKEAIQAAREWAEVYVGKTYPGSSIDEFVEK